MEENTKSIFDMESPLLNEKFMQGKAICEKYVLGNIPPEEIAHFLGVTNDVFREAIQQNAFPFAAPYKAGISDQKRCIIPALRFWSWLKGRI